MGPIKALFLDLGNVLFEVNLPATLGAFGLSSKDWDLSKVNTWDVYDAFERGELDAKEFFERASQSLGLKLSEKEFTKGWNACLADVVPGVEALLQDVQIPMYALSNTNLTHIDHLIQTQPLMGRFEELLTSFRLGCRKPEPLIYERALKVAGVQPNETLFVDDLPENVEAARAAGIHAFECKSSSSQLKEILLQAKVL